MRECVYVFIRNNYREMQFTHLQGSYDSMSSYDSYNNTNGNANYGANLSTSTGRLGPNVPDDLKSSSMPARAHDPYRSTFTRSTAQPISTHDSQTRTDYAKYRYAISVWCECDTLTLLYESAKI